MIDKKIRILLIENGLLGDYCATTAVGEALRKLFPDSQIFLLVKKSAEDFFMHAKLFDEFLFFDLPWTKVGLTQFSPWLWIDLLLFASKLRKKSFDYIITTRRDLYQFILLCLLRGNKKILPSKNAPTHFAKKAFSIVSALGYKEEFSPTIEIPKIYLDEADRIITKHFLEKRSFILIHPGSSYFLKRWQPSGFAELHSLLNDDGWQIAYMGYGKSDRVFMERIKSLLNKEVVYFDLPLFVSIAIVSLSAAVIGMDSGFSHIAAVLGIPTIALYGPTSPEYTGIIGSRVKLINHHSLCFCRSRHFCIPYSYLTLCSFTKHPCRAMSSITTQEVYTAINEILEDSEIKPRLHCRGGNRNAV